MKSKLFFRPVPMAAMAVSALALLSGCKTHERPVAYYSDGTYMGASGAGTQATAGYVPDYSHVQRTDQAQTQARAANEAVIPLHQETLRVGTREVDAGAVRIRKIVKTEVVNQPVQVRTESLVVDRVPAGSAAQANGAQPQGSIATPFQEGEVVIQLKKQEPVVETQVVPTGTVVAQTRMNTDQVNIQREVRREDVEVVKEGNVQNVTISQDLHSPLAAGAGPATGGAVTGAESKESSQPQPITDLSQLTGAADKSALAGRSVRISSAKVQSISADRTLLSAGPDENTKVWIRTGPAFEGIREGDMVSITGVVHTPAQSQSAFNEQTTQQLRNEPIYIEARTVEKVNP